MNRFLFLSAGIAFIAVAVYVFWMYVYQPDAKLSYGSDDPNSIRYLALGDSYVVGEGLPARDAWPAQLVSAAETQGIKMTLVSTIARNGWTSSQLIDNGQGDIIVAKPDFVTLQIGANDVIQGNSPQRFRDNLHVLYDQITGVVPASRVVVLTIPDFLVTSKGLSYERGGATAQLLREFNSIIKDVSAERNIAVVDVYEISKGMSGNPNLVSRDGFHPSSAEYQRWVQVILPTVTNLLPKQE